MNCENPETITKLINHVITSPDLTGRCTAQEASNMLLSLGRLEIRDREAFAALTQILVHRLNEAHAVDSQTIANSLWAYDAVGLEPPPELLSTWAREKLGLTVLEFNDESG